MSKIILDKNEMLNQVGLSKLVISIDYANRMNLIKNSEGFEIINMNQEEIIQIFSEILSENKFRDSSLKLFKESLKNEIERSLTEVLEKGHYENTSKRTSC